MIGVAILAWTLIYELEVVRPDRARLTGESARVADVGRSIWREYGFVDRLVTPIQARVTRSGPPQPSASWAPMFPALLGLGFRVGGGPDSSTVILAGALGFLCAMIMLYLVSRLALGTELAWVPPLVMALQPGHPVDGDTRATGRLVRDLLAGGDLLRVRPGSIGSTPGIGGRRTGHGSGRPSQCSVSSCPSWPPSFSGRNALRTLRVRTRLAVPTRPCVPTRRKLQSTHPART